MRHLAAFVLILVLAPVALASRSVLVIDDDPPGSCDPATQNRTVLFDPGPVPRFLWCLDGGTTYQSIGSGGVSDGAYGDVAVSGGGIVWDIVADAVGVAELATGAVTSDALASAVLSAIADLTPCNDGEVLVFSSGVPACGSAGASAWGDLTGIPAGFSDNVDDVGTDTTCLDVGVDCLFASSATEGGAAATALALDADPVDCGAGLVAQGVDAAGVPVCVTDKTATTVCDGASTFLNGDGGCITLAQVTAQVVTLEANLPTCDLANRGAYARLEAASGTADRFYICLKFSDDSYDWIVLAAAF